MARERHGGALSVVAFSRAHGLTASAALAVAHRGARRRDGIVYVM